MGLCASTVIPAPSIVTTITSQECVNILSTASKSTQIINLDDNYCIIKDTDFKNFANLGNVTVPGDNYKVDTFDCDDRAIVFLGKVREWYGKVTATNQNANGGITVGLLTGDLRLKATDPLRAHAVNVFIDENKQVMIYDPMWSSYYQIQPWMTIWTILI